LDFGVSDVCPLINGLLFSIKITAIADIHTIFEVLAGNFRQLSNAQGLLHLEI
jgi:hypothetical protein